MVSAERDARGAVCSTACLTTLVATLTGRVDARGLEVAADNTARGWARASELIEAGACFAVHVAPDVLALDFDQPDDQEAGHVFDAISAELFELGITPVVVASGREGHRHLFARIVDAPLRHRLSARARSVGIDVRARSPIRPPGVRHRSGATPRLLAPDSWDAAVDALSAPRRAERLPGRVWELLRRGDTSGRYRGKDGKTDPSRMFLALCNMAVFTGVDREHLWRLCQNPRLLGAASVHKRRARSELSARRFFDRTWACAEQSSWRRQPIASRADALGEVARLRELTTTVVFAGPTANSDRCVLDALYRLAVRGGGVVFPASIRALAQESGRDPKTVTASLRRLRMFGLIALVKCSERERAARFRLCEPDEALWERLRAEADTPAAARRVPTVVTSTGGEGTGGSLRVNAGHDAFAPGALGAGGFRVLVALGGDECDTVTLAARSGFHRRALRRHLTRLVAAGIVELLDDGSWRRTGSDDELEELLSAVADRAGTAGRAHARRERFRQERLRYQAFLAARDRRRLDAGVGVPTSALCQLPLSTTVHRGGAHERRGPPARVA